MNPNEIVLIDLSSIAHPIWHVSQSEPDPNKASQQIVARVRSLANGHPHVAICCDSGRSFRRDIADTYKANRPAQEAMLQHQIGLAREQLVADGFPVWAVATFEADDLIASAAARIVAPDSPAALSVLIVSADKDLLQLVGPRVRAMSARDGSVLDADAVGVKFGVRPDQMRDYLTLVGDASDNIKGARGIGPKKSADLLAKWGSLDAVYEKLDAVGGASMGLQTSVSAALREFRAQGDFERARALVTLRTDVVLPFEDITKPRVPKEVASFWDFGTDDEVIDDHDEQPLPLPTAERASQDVAPHVDAAEDKVIDLPGNGAPHVDGPSASRPQHPGPTALAVREPDAIMPAPAQWERQLDPRSMKDARVLARDMYDSRMFSAYGTPQGVLSTIMVGRELGIPAMASLRAIHNIEGRHALSAQLMVALIIKSGLAEYFDPVEFDDKHAIFETKRKGARKEIRLEHTIEMAKTAKLLKTDSNWEKVPIDMLVARAQSRLARLVYPDVILNLYTPDELAEIRERAA